MDGIPLPPYAIPVSIAADESIAFIDDDLGGHNANTIPSVTEVQLVNQCKQTADNDSVY